MTTSSPPSIAPFSHNPPRWLPWLFAALGFIGLADAGYLTAVHYLGVPLICTVVQGCEIVTTSVYAMIFGVPVALLGALYYMTIFFLAVWYIDSRRCDVLFTMAKLTVVGMIASLWFVAVQLFILKAICIYCMTSALISLVLFVFGGYTVGRAWIRPVSTP